MKEIKVYLINIGLTIDGVTDEDYLLDDELFMNEAERQGSVFSIEGFTREFNSDVLEISNSQSYIRFI
ncbi:MAG TPA: hypothetical protein VLA48_02880 [Nitrososphaeraceae archaeon]|nr:hypothetical protein [Nitrososphaeraceae archaeon]